jgi:6-phosphogluconate dehydrogenase
VEDGSGHFVKMVHNRIDYGDMQLICEAYHLMKDTLGMSEIFEELQHGVVTLTQLSLNNILVVCNIKVLYILCLTVAYASY